jgi:hypothetical protein
MEQERERQRLRAERARLHRQIADLMADGVHITDEGDSLARIQHREALDGHLDDFRAYRVALERFHRYYGPVGD